MLRMFKKKCENAECKFQQKITIKRPSETGTTSTLMNVCYRCLKADDKVVGQLERA
jgi:hypothetical protein